MTFSFGKSQPKKGPVQECLAREKKNRAIGHAADERRIEVTLVVRRQNHRAVIDHAFAMDHAKPEKNPATYLDEIVAEPVVGIQNTWRTNDLVN